jgi:hypothetical protein
MLLQIIDDEHEHYVAAFRLGMTKAGKKRRLRDAATEIAFDLDGLAHLPQVLRILRMDVVGQPARRLRIVDHHCRQRAPKVSAD